MYDSWTSNGIAPSRRSEFWRDISARAFVPMTPQLKQSHEFSAVMTHRTLDCLALNEVNGPAHDMWRTSKDVSCGGSETIFVNLYQAGRARIEQNGVEVDVALGELLLFDSSRPFKLIQPDHTSLLSLAVPKALLGRHNLLGLATRPIRLTDSASTMLLTNQMRALSTWKYDVPTTDALTIAEGLCGLVRATLSNMVDRNVTVSSRRHARGKVAAIIEKHYPDTNCTPVSAAFEMGISVRTLHSWLALDGTTFGNELWDYRLERARVLLQSADNMSVNDVALRCGFVSSAHLSKRFRERFGASPSASRNSFLNI